MLGVIDQPYTGERFMGGLGRAEMTRGAERRPLAVRACAGLADAVLYTTYPEVGSRRRARRLRGGPRPGADDPLRLRLLRLRAASPSARSTSSIEAGLQAYDIQGPQAVIEAAGGVVTDWQGGPAHRGGRVIAAGDPRVHAAALELLARV